MSDDQILDKIQSGFVSEDGCWIWRNDSVHGYGTIDVDSRTRLVHRLMYELVNGDIPEGLVIDHTCGQRNCINPDHLEAVTQRENVMRYKSKLTYCKNGHELTDDNVYIRPDRYSRNCRTCLKEASLRHKEAHRV